MSGDHTGGYGTYSRAIDRENPVELSRGVLSPPASICFLRADEGKVPSRGHPLGDTLWRVNGRQTR